MVESFEKEKSKQKRNMVYDMAIYAMFAVKYKDEQERREYALMMMGAVYNALKWGDKH